MTDWSRIVRPALEGLAAYDPGPSEAELRRVYRVAELVRLNRNEDLFGPFPGALEAAAAELVNASRYPEESFREFREAAAACIETSPERIVPGHGVQALIGTIATALLEPGNAVVVPHPSYGLYAQACTARGATVHRVELRDLSLDLEALAAGAHEHGARIVWVCDPNNPTGSLAREQEWRAFLDALPDGCVAVVDEAYLDYVDPELRLHRERDVEAGRALILLRSLSKLFGLAGLRLGYCVADAQLAHYLDVVAEPFNVNRPALAAGIACLRRPELIEARRQAAAEARALLTERLAAAGVEPLPSQANFVLAKVGGDDVALARELARREGLLVRPGSGFALPGYVRITIGPPALMERVARALGELVTGAPADSARPRRRVALIAHCLLNQNAKVEGGAKRPALWEPVIELLRERGYAIRQMPCPELAFGGARRFWGVREQFDTPLYRRHCRRVAKLVASVIEQHAAAGDEIVLIGVDSSPTMGIEFMPSAPHWAGRPDIGEDDSQLVRGDGIFIAELAAELRERGLPMPPSTGIRHWFADYDPAEERRRLEALLR
jgi:histidinol-phosphate aminotransferase